MKYGESVFDILYLLFAVISGCYLLKKAGNQAQTRMGIATLVLGFGDAFHLVPRVLNYFMEEDFAPFLGVGKFVTSVTMTLFYVLLYYVWLIHYRKTENISVSIWVWGAAIVRIALCLFPQNGWLQNSSDLTWSIIRNVPFVLLGGIILVLYYRTKEEDSRLKRVWLYILLSFLFYIPVAVAAGLLPMLGMLMLPKTVCYILMICAFLRTARTGI